VANVFTSGRVANLGAINTGLGWSITNIGAATSLIGTALADTIVGGTGADFIRGGDGDDTLTGAGGADTFEIDLGNDTITDLGTGLDIVQVALGAGVMATVSATGSWSASSNSSNLGTASISTPGRSVSLVSITNGNGWSITNTGAATALSGSAQADTMTGGAGNDTLSGSAGDDLFRILAGTDTVNDLGNGVDIVEVSTGATLQGTVSASWTATVGTYNDGTARLSTLGAAINLSAVTGGTIGWVISNGGGLGASMTGSGLNDTVTGGAGADTIAGAGGDDALNGGNGVDLVDYSGATGGVSVDLSANSATGAAGNDSLGGFEQVRGSAHNDTLKGSLANDTLTGGLGNDQFLIAAGTDVITDLGNDVDIVIVDDGATLNATISAAWIATSSTANNGVANLSTDGKAVDLTGVTSTLGRGWTITNTGAATSIDGSGYADILIGGDGDDTLFGSQGDDSINGGGGQDLLQGGAGQDTLVGNGFDTMEGGGGADLFRILDAELIDVRGVTGSISFDDSAIDTLDLSLLTSGATTVLFTTDFNAEVSIGGSVKLTLNSVEGFILANVANTFTGRAQAESVTGGNLNDTLSGGAGNDTLNGGDGIDQIAPGTGADQVNLGNGNDVMLAEADWVNDLIADSINGGAGFDTLKLQGVALQIDLTNAALFADNLIESIERIDLRSVQGGQVTLDASSILALTDMPSTTSGLIIDGDSDDTLIASLSGALAGVGTQVLLDLNGNGTLNDRVDDIGSTNASGLVSYDFGLGAGQQTYAVYADTSSYRLLLVDSDIDRSGILFV
jgi:Ca2+-binding RTX toxin-like protein